MFFEYTYNAVISFLYKSTDTNEIGDVVLGTPESKSIIGRLEIRRGKERYIAGDRHYSDAVFYCKEDTGIEEGDIVGISDKSLVFLGNYLVSGLRRLDALTYEQTNLEIDLKEFK